MSRIQLDPTLERLAQEALARLPQSKIAQLHPVIKRTLPPSRPPAPKKRSAQDRAKAAMKALFLRPCPAGGLPPDIAALAGVFGRRYVEATWREIVTQVGSENAQRGTWGKKGESAFCPRKAGL